MVEYSKCRTNRYVTEKTKNCCQKWNRNKPENELKILDGNDLPHELLLTTRWKAKLRNAFNNNMSTDVKLPKAQVLK